MPGYNKSAEELLNIGGMDAASGRVERDSLISEATVVEIATAWFNEGFLERPGWAKKKKSMTTAGCLRDILEGIWASTLQYTAEPLGDVDHTLAVMHASGILKARLHDERHRGGGRGAA
jgi:hypothetical protein